MAPLSGTNKNKSNSDQIERVQRKAARFVERMYTRYSSVSYMLDVLGCPPLSQMRQETFEYVIIEAYKGTRRKHNKKFRQFFPKTICTRN